MNNQHTHMINCSMCGHTFDPLLHLACQNCPLKKGCNLVCCPQCGYEMVDVQQSKLARLAARFIAAPQPKMAVRPTLAEIIPGGEVKVIGFGSMLPGDRQAQLQSFGLIPGRVVRVVQHAPVTIIQVENTELALETEMAREIQVEVTA